MQRLPSHGPCLVCGPKGMGIPLDWDPEKKEITASFVFDERQQGPPAHAHGGASAAVIDEAMGAAVWMSGHRVVAAHLEFDYKRPVPLGVPLRVVAHAGPREGKRVPSEGAILLPDGKPAVTGRGVFVEALHIFKDVGFGWRSGEDEEWPSA